MKRQESGFGGHGHVTWEKPKDPFNNVYFKKNTYHVSVIETKQPWLQTQFQGKPSKYWYQKLKQRQMRLHKTQEKQRKTLTRDSNRQSWRQMRLLSSLRLTTGDFGEAVLFLLSCVLCNLREQYSYCLSSRQLLLLGGPVPLRQSSGYSSIHWCHSIKGNRGALSTSLISFNFCPWRKSCCSSRCPGHDVMLQHKPKTRGQPIMD